MTTFEQGVVQSLGTVENGVARLDQRLVRPVTPGMYLSDFLSLPGLVGLWWMGNSQRSTGNVYDLSGQARTLTYNGNPIFTYDVAAGLAIPYISLDGAGDYLSRADETDLDILGSEAIYNASVRGLTLYVWFRPTATSGGVNLILAGKLLAATQWSYWLAHNSADGLTFNASGDGTTNAVNAVSAGAVTIGGWNLGIGRYIPSTSGVVWLNGVPTTDAAGIPAALFNGTASFNIGATGTPGSYFNGGVAIAALYSQAHTTAWINWLWTRGRVLFGV